MSSPPGRVSGVTGVLGRAERESRAKLGEEGCVRRGVSRRPEKRLCPPQSLQVDSLELPSWEWDPVSLERARALRGSGGALQRLQGLMATWASLLWRGVLLGAVVKNWPV